MIYHILAQCSIAWGRTVRKTSTDRRTLHKQKTSHLNPGIYRYNMFISNLCTLININATVQAVFGCDASVRWRWWWVSRVVGRRIPRLGWRIHAARGWRLTVGRWGLAIARWWLGVSTHRRRWWRLVACGGYHGSSCTTTSYKDTAKMVCNKYVIICLLSLSLYNMSFNLK